ncbi:MAG: 30S ribosomal protein S16 [Patescibacteria group bacterium]|jgi:small subunit ribosomal protein S16
MLAIKLSRIGKKNQPHYRLIICEKGRDPYGEALEILGNYNPHSKDLQVKNERIKYWISKGAQMTPTVNNLLVENKIIEGKKVKASKNPKNTEIVEKSKEEAPKAEAPASAEAAKEAVADKPAEAEAKE